MGALSVVEHTVVEGTLSVVNKTTAIERKHLGRFLCAICIATPPVLQPSARCIICSINEMI
jgi:hypothetical protein